MLFYQFSILVGVSLIIYSLDRLYRLLYPVYRAATAGRNWPEATATVANMRLNSFSRRRKYFWAEAKYFYRVDEVEYFGRLKLETLIGRQETALQNTEKFPAGKKLLVRYNPENPAECYSKYDRPGAYELISILWMPFCGAFLVLSAVTHL